MQSPDLNLLFALDVLLEEGMVVGAARRMNLSVPAMSRTLARIRETVGDPVFVKVGRKMVPTPRALALREAVRNSVNSARLLLQPEQDVDLTTLERGFPCTRQRCVRERIRTGSSRACACGSAACAIAFLAGT